MRAPPELVGLNLGNPLALFNVGLWSRDGPKDCKALAPESYQINFNKPTLVCEVNFYDLVCLCSLELLRLSRVYGRGFVQPLSRIIRFS